MVSYLNHFVFRNFFLYVFIILTYKVCTCKLYFDDTLTGLHACREVPPSMRLSKGFGADAFATTQKGIRASREEKSEMELMCLGDISQ